jgi:hypothetical protein
MLADEVFTAVHGASPSVAGAASSTAKPPKHPDYDNMNTAAAIEAWNDIDGTHI